MTTLLPISSVEELRQALRDLKLLGPAQLQELSGGPYSSLRHPRALARRLVGAGWLTDYQAQLLLQGRGAELVLGQYCLLEELGAGGMGQVFKARHQLMKRVVALKLIRHEFVAQPEALDRFHREIQLAAQLTHPNIVVAYDAEQAGDRTFLVMEYCDGLNLAQLVRQVGPLPVGRACDYVRQMALGLQYASERGLIHRDVKPENVMVTAGGVKLLDLGLARLRQRDESATSTRPLTQVDVIMGTPDYMAPEQAADLVSADARSDIYSLGCSFYFTLAGQVPFPGGSALEKMLRHRVEELPPLGRLRADVPVQVLAILDQMAAKDPAARYQTAAEVAAALEPFARREDLPPVSLSPGHDLLGPPTTAAGRTVAAPSFHPSPTAAPTPEPGPPATTRVVRRSADGPVRPGARGRRSRALWLGASAVLAVAVLLLVVVVPRLASPHDRRAERATSQEVPRVIPPRSGVRVLPAQQPVQIDGVAFSRDSTTLAVAYGLNRTPGYRGFVQLWDAATGRPRGAAFTGHQGSAWCVALAPDGRLLASGGGTPDPDATGLPGEVILWSVETGRALARLAGHKDGTLALAFTPDGERLVTAGRDGTVRVWAVGMILATAGRGPAVWGGDERPGLCRVLTHHAARVNAVSLSPDGRLLASGSSDKTVKLWDLNADKLLDSWTSRRGGNFVCVAFSPDGRKLAAGTSAYHLEQARPEVLVAEVRAGRLREPAVADEGADVLALDFAPDNRRLLTGLASGTVVVRDSATLAKTATYRWHDHGVWAVRFSPDGKDLATGSWNGDVVIRDWPLEEPD